MPTKKKSPAKKSSNKQVKNMPPTPLTIEETAQIIKHAFAEKKTRKEAESLAIENLTRCLESIQATANQRDQLGVLNVILSNENQAILAATQALAKENAELKERLGESLPLDEAVSEEPPAAEEQKPEKPKFRIMQGKCRNLSCKHDSSFHRNAETLCTAAGCPCMKWVEPLKN